MPNYALVNPEAHKDIRIITERGAALGDNIQVAMTFQSEFRNIQGSYPILFQKFDDEFIPVALFGFERDENLFLTDEGWNASYIPAMMRKEPFLIGLQKGGEDEEAARVFSIDMDSPRVNTERGEALFDPLGKMTPYL